MFAQLLTQVLFDHVVYVFYYRVFTLGIGYGASTSLVKGIARAGNGCAVFIEEDGSIQAKVLDVLCLEFINFMSSSS